MRRSPARIYEKRHSSYTDEILTQATIQEPGTASYRPRNCRGRGREAIKEELAPMLRSSLKSQPIIIPKALLNWPRQTRRATMSRQIDRRRSEPASQESTVSIASIGRGRWAGPPSATYVNSRLRSSAKYRLAAMMGITHHLSAGETRASKRNPACVELYRSRRERAHAAVIDQRRPRLSPRHCGQGRAEAPRPFRPRHHIQNNQVKPGRCPTGW